MGLLGSLGRFAGRAALRGTGQLVAVVVPDSMSPWNLRRKSANTTSSLLGLGLRALRKKKKKKRSTKRSDRPTRAAKAMPSAFLPWPGWPNLDFANVKANIKADLNQAKANARANVKLPKLPKLSFLSWGLPGRSKNKKPSTSKKSQVRASTTKGKLTLSRRPSKDTMAAIVVHAPVANEVRFDKNRWARGAGLTSSTDWDSPSPAKWRPTSRLKRAGRRKKQLVKDRRKEYQGYLQNQR